MSVVNLTSNQIQAMADLASQSPGKYDIWQDLSTSKIEFERSYRREREVHIVAKSGRTKKV